MKEGEDADSIKKQLLNRDISKKEWRRINMVSKGRHNGGLNKLIILDRENPSQRKECHQKRKIEEALLQHNKNECLQTHNAPLLTQPLVSELGLEGDGPEAENVLKGECAPVNGVDDATLAHSLALESPIKDRLDDLEPPQITPQDDIDDPKKTKERTSSSPSGLHCGLWKANSQDGMINEIDTTFRISHSHVVKR